MENKGGEEGGGSDQCVEQTEVYSMRGYTQGQVTWLFFLRRMKKKVSKNSINFENQYHQSAFAIYMECGGEW